MLVTDAELACMQEAPALYKPQFLHVLDCVCCTVSSLSHAALGLGYKLGLVVQRLGGM